MSLPGLKARIKNYTNAFAKKYPRLSYWMENSEIFVLAFLVGLVVFYFANGDDRQTLTTASQSLIQLAAFLAAASGVLTAIYLGQVLKGIPENVEKTIPPYQATLTHAIADAASRATSQENQLELTTRAVNTAFKDWHDSVMGSMSGARRIRIGGRIPLFLLVSSAISAVCVILSGSSLLLGLSVGLMVLATWSIFRSWRVAEESMQGVIGVAAFFRGVPPESIRTVHPDPRPEDA